MEPLKRKWLLFAVAGLLLIGAGLSMSIDAAILRYNQLDTIYWMMYGTFGLVIFNSGICLFGQAVIYKVKLDDKKVRNGGELQTKDSNRSYKQ